MIQSLLATLALLSAESGLAWNVREILAYLVTAARTVIHRAHRRIIYLIIRYARAS